MPYTEIFKLKKMLEDENILFEFFDRSWDLSEGSRKFKHKDKFEHYQICVSQGFDRIISVIQGDGSYGREADPLEICGLLTKEEKEDEPVLGHLSAEEVLERIKKHFKNESGQTKNEIDQIKSEERIFITPEEALKCLCVKDNQVHCILNPVLNIMVGADWPIEDVKETLWKSKTIEIGGEQCLSLGHGIVATERKTPHFFEHDEEKIKKYLRGIK